MRVIALVLGAVVPLALIGCIGAETDEQDDAADIGVSQAATSWEDPTPHGRTLCPTMMRDVGVGPHVAWQPCPKVVAR